MTSSAFYDKTKESDDLAMQKLLGSSWHFLIGKRMFVRIGDDR